MTKLSEEVRHVLQCIVDGSALWQDEGGGWYIGGEYVPEAVAVVMWCDGFIVATRNWKVWDITDAGRAVLAQGDGHD